MAASIAPLAVTIGEPAGIGPDIILKAWLQRKQHRLPPFIVIGDAALLTRRALDLGISVSTAAYEFGESPSPLASALPVISLKSAMHAKAGRPDKRDAELVTEAIEIAVKMAFAGEAAGIVTCPIAKEVLYESGFRHPGHTEFLGALAEEETGKKHRPVMMIASDVLRTVPVTIHIPLADVPSALTSEAIFETARIAAADLQRCFAIARPRLAVSGLNPHAGEGGKIGQEEQRIIQPAIEQLRRSGVDATGPWPADTLFHAKARANYDAAICMYHDQALIPAKALAFDDGVNVTLGLPFIRTSPDHGTAFDIAGSGKASPDSFIAALKMAWQMAKQDHAA